MSVAGIRNSISARAGPDSEFHLGWLVAPIYHANCADVDDFVLLILCCLHRPPHSTSCPDIRPHIQIIIGRDMNQDPLAHQIASQLSLSLNPSSYQNMDSNTFSRISLAAAQIYEGLYGENYRAVYVEKTRVGCGHSKVGVLVFEGFLRVSTVVGLVTREEGRF